MTSSTWDRSRHRSAAAAVLGVIAAVVGVLVLAVGVSVPKAWWPHTGQAFAAHARPSGHDRCALIVGPAKDYCEGGATTTAFAERPGVAGAAWRLVSAGAGVAALVVWRLRTPAGQRRR
jgi:O-succinylbenzoate synthase